MKASLKARARDQMYRLILGGGAVRGILVNAGRMAVEMRANHRLGILETYALGQAYLAAVLMASDLKSADRLRLQIHCRGPLKGLTVEANAFGEVRGYLHTVPIPLQKPLESFDLAPLFGAGVLSVTRYLQDAKQPFSGQTALLNGSLAKDLANYYLESEQIPTAFHLSIKFDRQGSVTGAGGLFLQALPRAADDLLADLEERVARLPSLGDWSEAGASPEAFLEVQFGDHRPRILDRRRIEFHCPCTRERMAQYIRVMPLEELADILQKGPFPVEVTCHFCNSRYQFDRSEIQRMHDSRNPAQGA